MLDNHTFGQALNAATLQIHHSSAGNTTQKELLTKLGAIALVSLAQGTGQISHEQVRAIEESPFSPEMLVETGLLQAAGLGQYQFPHQRIQEYFAGRSLAGKLLSKDEHERASVKRLVSEHKYAPQYGRMLSFMAGEVSSMAGFEGVEQLLTLLGEEQELVGLQHLLLQLRVIHEWLCVAEKQEIEQGMAVLERKFQLLTSLEQWFVNAFNHVRREGSWHTGTGQQLLDLLKGSLQSFGSVAKHAPDLFQLLRRVAKDDSLAVRKAVLSLLVDPSAAWAPEALSIIRELLEDEDPYASRTTLRTLLPLAGSCPAWTREALALIRSSLQDSYAYVRREALEALSSLIQASPERSEAALGIIRSALQDKEGRVRSAALDRKSVV